MKNQRNGKPPRKPVLLCVEYDGASCKMVKMHFPKRFPAWKQEQMLEKAQGFETLSDLLDDFWNLVSGEAPDGEYMWFSKWS